MRPLPHTVVFTRDDLRDLGWTDSAISRAIAAGRLRQVRRGVLAGPGADGNSLRAFAAVRAVAGSVLSHRSALAAHGLPVVGGRPRLPELTVAPRSRGDAHTVLLHRAALPQSDVVVRDSTALTSVARTVVDVARSRPLSTAVAAIDAALNQRRTSMTEIDDVLVRCWNWPYIGRAQRALRHVDGRAESALESISRLAIRLLRLPVPLLQPLVRDDSGIAVARLDFYWDGFGVFGEADGRANYLDAVDLWTDKQRGDDLGQARSRRRPLGIGRRVAQPAANQRPGPCSFIRGAARDR